MMFNVKGQKTFNTEQAERCVSRARMLADSGGEVIPTCTCFKSCSVVEKERGASNRQLGEGAVSCFDRPRSVAAV